jgi:potassium channel subfamily K
LSSLAIFWIVGAACFQAMENWTFWDALYFESKLDENILSRLLTRIPVVFCLTIGYGDFSPESQGGRVFFVIYSIAAVPLIASFVVRESRPCSPTIHPCSRLTFMVNPETVTGLLSTYSNHQVAMREREQTNVDQSPAFTAHRDFVIGHHASFERILKEKRNALRPERDASPDTSTEADLISEATIDEERALTEYVLEHALRLEAIARRLLIDTLPRGSLARTILLADREVQLRDVEAVGGDPQKLRRLATEEDPLATEPQFGSTKSPAGEANDNLDAIRRYRETFAGLVAGGARLQKLEGEQKFIFERRRAPDKSSDSASREERDPGWHPEHRLTALSRQERSQERKRLYSAIMHSEKDDRSQA